MLTDMLSCIYMLPSKHLFIPLKIEKKKTELNELSELKCLKTPSQMNSYAHRYVFLYLHTQSNINTLLYWVLSKKWLPSFVLKSFLKRPSNQVRDDLRVKDGLGGGFRVRVRDMASIRARGGLGTIYYCRDVLESKLRPSGIFENKANTYKSRAGQK